MTIADFQCKLRYGWIGLLGLLAWLDLSQAQDALDRHTMGNRLMYRCIGAACSFRVGFGVWAYWCAAVLPG